MKTKFKYKFKKYVYVIMIVAILLALAVVAMQLVRFIKYGYDPSNLFSQIITVVLSLFIIILLFSVIFFSFYEVDEKNFTLRWGILKNEISIKEITKVIHSPEENKLTVFWGAQDNFMVISAFDVEVLDIVDCLRKYNKKILYESVSSQEN